MSSQLDAFCSLPQAPIATESLKPCEQEPKGLRAWHLKAKMRPPHLYAIESGVPFVEDHVDICLKWRRADWEKANVSIVMNKL